jgi:peptidyl-prolyl cis-trans isomerase C
LSKFAVLAFKIKKDLIFNDGKDKILYKEVIPMKKVSILLTLIIASSLFLTACQNIFSPTRSTATNSETQISGPLLAQVDDWKIGLDDFDKSLAALEPLVEKENIKIDRDFKIRVLEELVNNALLAQEAKRRGFDQDKDVIDAVNRYRQTILAEKLKSEVAKDVYVSDKEVEDFYTKSKERLKEVPEFKVREIAVDTESKAKELNMRLLQGEDFATVALSSSMLESARKGGDLGYISYDPKKKFDKFWNVIAALDEGSISNVFKGDDGKYYIVKLEAKRAAEPPPLSKIKDDLKKRLEDIKRAEKLSSIINTAKEKSKDITNVELLK